MSAGLRCAVFDVSSICVENGAEKKQVHTQASTVDRAELAGSLAFLDDVPVFFSPFSEFFWQNSGTSN